jgi:hypothetical protein
VEWMKKKRTSKKKKNRDERTKDINLTFDGMVAKLFERIVGLEEVTAHFTFLHSSYVGI